MMSSFFLGIGMYWMFTFFILALLALLLWLWMLVEALKRRDVLWIVLLLFSLFTGFLVPLFAFLYYLLEYEKRSVKRKS